MKSTKHAEQKQKVLDYIAQRRGLFIPLAAIHNGTNVNYPQLKVIRQALLNEKNIDECEEFYSDRVELALRVPLQERIIVYLDEAKTWVEYRDLSLGLKSPEKANLDFHLGLLVQNRSIERVTTQFCLASHAEGLRANFNIEVFWKEMGHQDMEGELTALEGRRNIDFFAPDNYEGYPFQRHA